MSDEKQQELPGMPASTPAIDVPIHGIENLRNAPPLDWDEPALVDAEKPAKVLTGDAGASAPKSKARSRKPKARNTEPTVDSETGQQPAKAASTRKRTKGTSVAAANQKQETTAELPGSDAPVVKTVRALRKKTVKAAVLTEQGQSSAGQAPANAAIPAITTEAIAFLGDPDARAADLFRLRPESQAFVAYHITNMQRLDAASELAHSALAATAPKFSPRFEKVADALLASIAKKSQVAVDTRTTEQDEPAATVPLPSYSPRPATRPPAYVSVQLGKMEITPDRGRALESTTVGQDAGNSPPVMHAHGTGAPTPSVKPELLELHENSIEQGIAPRRESESRRNPQDAKPYVIPSAETTSPLMPSRGASERLFRVLRSAAQAAGEWFHNKRDGQPTVPLAVETPPLAKLGMLNVPDSSPDRSLAFPEEVARRFFKVDQDYYFPDKTHAFSDRGDRLSTRGDHPEVVRSLVEIAKARGWDSITVKGTDEFRRSAWMEASKSGLSVAGYKPTPLDLAELARQPAHNVIEKQPIKDRSAIPAAPVSQQPDTIKGEASAWSEASKHVLKASGPDAELEAKARSFEKDKPAFVVKKHPDLAPAYGVVDAAKKFAETNLPEEGREEFIGLARRHVMQKIIGGEPVKGPKIYRAPAKDKPTLKQADNSAQEQIDFGKSPRSKEVMREK